MIHRFVRRFCHVKMAVDAFLKPPPLEAPKSPVSDGAGPSDAFVLPLEDKHALLAPRKASLRGFYDFLESSGETFEGGYPYDAAKWRPLQLLIREHYFVPQHSTQCEVKPLSSAAAFALDAIDNRVEPYICQKTDRESSNLSLIHI